MSRTLAPVVYPSKLRQSLARFTFVERVPENSRQRIQTMRLESGKKIDRIGTVSDRHVIRPESGQPFVKASLLVEGKEDQLTIVWWDAARAPREGARIRVQGTVRIFNHEPEIRADQTTVERKEPPQDYLAAIAGFYLGCVEAETAGSLRLTPGSSDHIELVGGMSPLHGPIVLPNNQITRRWCQLRQATLGETLLSGWPLVVGMDPDPGNRRPAVAPLLIAEVELNMTDGDWQLERLGDGVDLNPFALRLLGLDRDERAALVTVVGKSIEVEESTTSGDCAKAILRVLEDAGVDGLKGLDPMILSPLSNSAGIHNAGAIMATTGNLASTRKLIEDLEALVNTPELMAEGPAAVLLGKISAPEVPLPKPHPTIALSSVKQDEATHSAMENIFTVVTGPPGTGKSQVLVNVVTAAVTRGETVLFASKNNRAVDVVVERLRLTSPHAVVVRAGGTGKRSEVAQYIAEALAASPRPVNPASARRNWGAVEERLQDIYEVLHERARIEGELAGVKTELSEYLGRLPLNTVIDIDLDELDSALASVQDALDAFGKWLGLFWRWRRHQRRLDCAREALGHLGFLLGLSRSKAENCLSSVANRPKRSLAPRRDFRSIEHIVSDLHHVLECRERISGIKAQLAKLPQKNEIDDRLSELSKERIDAGTKLLDARWEELRTADPIARTAANECADLLERVASRGGGLRKALGRIPVALPVLPVWAVTNLSARTNLPLKTGLFDLVVIDEASQCDVASALPLLVRGKRALITGDRKQLIHITSLSRSREQVIARKWGLRDDQADEFSYRDRSCFGLASDRVQASPIFLDLHFRSHPAISGFANKQFYGEKMELCSDARPPSGMRAIEWIRISGRSDRGPRGRSRVNREEAHRVAREITQALPTYKGLGCSVGVVTPYGAQDELIRALLSEMIATEDMESMKIATAHRFQGDERDIMYFSPVIDETMPEQQVRFVADPNLINVALTRARRRLVIVGDLDACLKHRTALKDLGNYVARLEAGGFDSPLELDLYEALLKQGIAAKTGVVVGHHRLDLAIEHDGIRLDVECDGAAFHMDREKDAARDRAIEAEGWRVMRFSGRHLSRDMEGCVEAIMKKVASA